MTHGGSKLTRSKQFYGLGKDMVLFSHWLEYRPHSTSVVGEARDPNSRDYKMNSQEDFETREK